MSTGQKTPKQIFIDEVDRLFMVHEVDPAARGVLYNMKREKSSSKTKPASETIKSSILEVLRSSQAPLNREQIAEALGTDISPNSISAYASQLVSSGEVVKSSQKYAFFKKTLKVFCLFLKNRF